MYARFLCVLYSSIRNSTNSTASKLSGADKILASDTGASDGGGSGDAEAGGQRVWDNEEDTVGFEILFFAKSLRETVFFLGRLLLVALPPHVRPGYALRHDDAH